VAGGECGSEFLPYNDTFVISMGQNQSTVVTVTQVGYLLVLWNPKFRLRVQKSLAPDTIMRKFN
jgi:hypothetical protein